MNQYLGKRVLARVLGDNKLRMTCVQAISPNGAYVCLEDYSASGWSYGWAPVDFVTVVDVLGDSDERMDDLFKRLKSTVEKP